MQTINQENRILKTCVFRKQSTFLLIENLKHGVFGRLGHALTEKKC